MEGCQKNGENLNGSQEPIGFHGTGVYLPT